MASPEKKARYDVNRQVKDAMEWDDWAEVARILSECSRRDSDSVMTQLVSRDQWDDVQQVIRCVGDEERTWNIKGAWVKNNILLSVAEGNWRGIGEMPHERFLHSTLDWILEQACTRAKQTDIVKYVLPHCEDDHLDSALQQLVTHGLWFAAGRMLLRPVSDGSRRLVIQEVCQRADELSLCACIIPFCPSSTIDFFLTELVSRDMWYAVGHVMMRGVSDTKHCWALKEACSRVEGWRIKRLLLPYCTYKHCSSVLTDLVSEGQWERVKTLLFWPSYPPVAVIANGMYLDNDCLRLIVNKRWENILHLLANNTKDSKEVQRFCKSSLRDANSEFQIYCRHMDVLQPVKFDTNMTWVYGKQGFPPIVRDMASVFAVKRDIGITGHHEETVVCIIPRCSVQQLNSVYTQCFDKCLKKKPGYELVFNFSDMPDSCSIHRFDVNAANAQTTNFLTQQITEDQLDSVLRNMFTLPAWWALGKVLEQGLADNSVTKILKQTLLYDDDQMIVEHVLPHCTDSQTDLVVTELVSAGQWKSVTKLVQLVGDRKQTWTVGGTSVDTTLLHLVAGGRWGEVGDMLRRGVDDAQFRWAADRVILYADDECAKHILSLYEYRYNEHIDLILTKNIADGWWKLVRRLLELDVKEVWTVDEVSIERGMLQLLADKKWSEIDVMLSQGVGDPHQKWLMHTASVHTEEMAFITYILPHCADDQLDSVLTTLVERRLWWAVGEMLNLGVSDSVKQWAVMEACQHCDEADIDILHDILPHCADDQLDSVLTTLVEQGMWFAVGEMLNLGVSDSVKRWAVHEMCKHLNTSDCDDEYFTYSILPHCADDQLDVVLKTLAEQREWWCVKAMCDRGVSDSVKKWVVHEMYKHLNTSIANSDDEYITYIILSLCTDDQRDSVLTTLVKRRLWGDVGETLKRGISDSVKQWAVMEASQHYDDSRDYSYADKNTRENIFLHCADDQLDTVMTTLVKRRQWLAVGDMLKRGVSDAVKQWAVMEACQHYVESNRSVFTDRYLVEDILPRCVDDQVDSVLKTLVKRRLWSEVLTLIERGVSDSVKHWAVKEACKQGTQSHVYILRGMISHCADDQLDSVLTTLLKRRLWRAVGEMLQRGVSDSVRRWAMMEAIKHCDDSDNDRFAHEYIAGDILPYCFDDQLDTVLTKLVEIACWKAVGKVLSRFPNAFVHNCLVQKACEHCKDTIVYFKDDNNTPADVFTPDVLLLFADDELDLLQHTFITRDTCTAVRYESDREVSDSQRRANIKTVFKHADQESLIKYVCPYYVYDSIHSALECLATRCFWKAFSLLLHYCIIDTLCMWSLATDDIESKEKVFLDMVRNPCDGVKRQIPSFWRLVNWSDLLCSLNERLDWDTLLSEVLCEVLLGAVKEIWLSGQWKEMPSESTKVMDEASLIVKELHQLLIPVLIKCNTSCVPYLLPKIHTMRHRLDKKRSTFSPFLSIYFTKCLIQEYYKRKAWQEMTNAILVALTTIPVVPDVQSVALRVMLRHNRWDVIKHACLSCVCEQDRRQLFQTAVKQRQWSAVKRWADHTLYDDQRLWALGEARQEERWDVYLKLADHGLSEWERVGVLFRVTMHADWKLVRHMLRTVADVTDMIDLLTNTPRTLSKLWAKNYKQLMSNLKECKKDLTTDTNTLRTLKAMAKRGKWWIVLHNIRHKPNLENARHALKAAVSSEAWHAVMQLVRLETDVTGRDTLFREMVRLRQWAVCRELLEQGVSHDLSLELFPEFIEHCQWTLVAMVMECPMVDDRRKTIMHRAILRREGSVVWECINKLQTRLSVDEREDLFQLAFNREVWQAVKPLIEEKDETGMTHRDTALLEAIEQHQWDVVDHCQRHHADINMKDDDGHTPIHRAARKGDWEAVKELTVRDGDPNLLDSEGLSVLHRAIAAEQWDAVKLLIQFHGDIHQAPQCKGTFYDYEKKTRTPLRMLIDARQGEVIDSSLMWCPDQQKIVNCKRETALHAVCLSGWPDTLYHLIARQADPLAKTDHGHTALCYAVLCRNCPQRMVAACLELGFSTHQPHITDTAWTVKTSMYNGQSEKHKTLVSPLVFAVMRGLPVVTQILYESGACSNRQLFELADLPEHTSREGKLLKAVFEDVWRNTHGILGPAYSFGTELMKQSADYLHQVSSTPRSLVSTCRLVISHCLTLSKTRHRDIAQLSLSPMMKEYLMFSDLTDPRYPDLSYRGKE